MKIKVNFKYTFIKYHIVINEAQSSVYVSTVSLNVKPPAFSSFNPTDWST